MGTSIPFCFHGKKYENNKKREANFVPFKKFMNFQV